MTEESSERIDASLVDRIDPTDPATFVFDPADYMSYDDDSAVVSFAWIKGELGIVLWNLEPGQWNDYHLHPETEHLHVVLTGEVDYHLAGLPPVRVRAGQAVIVPAQVAHGIENTGAERATYMAVTSPGDYQKVLVDRPSHGGAA